MKIHCFVCAALFAVFVLPGCASFGEGDFQEIISRAGERVFPSVVYIQSVRSTLETGRDDNNAVFGSGVIIHESGEVLTNHHVIERGRSIRCQLNDGRTFAAKLIGSDKDIDLALLKLEVPPDSAPLPVAVLAEQTAVRGDFVMAMGAPWGFSRSVSFGIISCASRSLSGKDEYSLWYQTDASISPGNSGGPLVNKNGEIVGINTLGINGGGTVGFAVPSDTIKGVLPRLREYGSVNWAWLGLQLQPLYDFERNIRFPFASGVVVAGTEPGSPARKSGFLPNDCIVAVDGSPVNAPVPEELPDLRRRLGLLPFDREVSFTVLRNGGEIIVTATPTRKGGVEGDQLACPRWNFTAKTINRFDTPNLYYYRTEGVYVMGVNHAPRMGTLNVNDVILSINGVEIKDLETLKNVYEDALKNIEKNSRAILSYQRNGQIRQMVLSFSEEDH